MCSHESHDGHDLNWAERVLRQELVRSPNCLSFFV